MSIKKELKLTEQRIQTVTTNNQTQPKYEIVFGISLKSKVVSHDWKSVERNLSKTLKSILYNSDQNFRVVIAGHEKPKITELAHERVTFLEVDFPPPEDNQKLSRDKMHKRRIIGAYLKKIGFSGYFMPLDADDWIHYRFVEYIRSLPQAEAFVFNRGVMANLDKKEMWLRKGFYRGCGSSAVFLLLNQDFPDSSSKEDSKKVLFHIYLKAHSKILENLQNVNKKYVLIEEPLVTYVIGNGENISIIDEQRKLFSASDYYVKGEGIEEYIYRYFKVTR